MLRPNPSAEWDRFGERDPYYGVCASDEFRGRRLDAASRDRFFATGEEHVESVFALVREALEPDFEPDSVLDYGCGVGRLVLPFARRAERVVGVDVSPAMLEFARENCRESGAQGVEFVTADRLDGLAGDFDLVHSALVFQHIPVREGERILGALAGLLRPGGIASIHLTTRAKPGLALYNALMKLPLVHNLVNVVRRRPWSYPHMQMNSYDLTRLLRLLHERGIGDVYVRSHGAFAGYDACTLVFRAPGD